MFLVRKSIQIFRRIRNRLLIFLIVVLPAFWCHIKGYVTLYGFFGIGDICYELAFINSYKESIKKKIRVITIRKRFAVFSFYDAIDKVSSISYKMEQLLLYDDVCVKQLSRYSFMKDVAHYRINDSETTIKKMRICYGANAEEALTYPTLDNNFGIIDDKIKGSVLINFNSNCYKSDKIKSILIELGNVILNQGDNIYINTSNDEDVLLFNKGAIKYYKPLELVFNEAHLFKAIISIRSGFLDLLINSNANIICLYSLDDKGRFLHTNFSLTEWRGNSTINEFFVEEIEITSLLHFVN